MHTLKLMSLTGPFVAVATYDVSSTGDARELVEKYAADNGYSRVKLVDEDDMSLRFTATTPGGRGGRNIAFLDYGYDGDLDELDQ